MPRTRRLIAALMALAWLPNALPCAFPSVSLAAPVATRDLVDENDYARLLDAESQGLFSRLLAADDLATTIADYDALLTAYTAIVEELYEQASPHSIRFPQWYAERLPDLALDALPLDEQAGSVAFFLQQLERPELDAVLHAYYVLSLNPLPLVQGRKNKPTKVRKAMLRAAREDPEQRYWIALTLAERAMLRDTERYAELGTQQASKGSSMREAVGRSAKVLGARIHRVLGLPADPADPRADHFQINEARKAADARIEARGLIDRGRSGAYAAIDEEIAALDQDAGWSSSRYLEILASDLPRLSDEFGPPADRAAMIANLQRLYEERGEARLRLRIALGELERIYAPRIAQQPASDDAQPPPELPGIHEIAAMPADEAWAFVIAAMEDSENPAQIERLFLDEVVPTLVTRMPDGADPEALRHAVLAGYHRLGHPRTVRAEYFAALDALPSEERRDATFPPLSAAELTSLVAAFDSVRDRAALREASRQLMAPANARRLARTGEPKSRTTSALMRATERLLVPEIQARRRAVRERDAAAARAEDAAQALATAEQTIADANRTIARANEAMAAHEQALDAAVEARNQAVAELNRSVTAHERSVQSLQEAHRSGARSEEQRAERVRAIERAEALELERQRDARAAEDRLLPQIAAYDEAIRGAEAALAGAESEGQRALRLAKAAKARAGDAIREENEATERRIAMQAEEQSQRRAIASLLGRSLLALESIDARASADALGDATAESATRLATIALLGIDACEAPPTRDGLAALEREHALADPLTRPITSAVLDLFDSGER